MLRENRERRDVVKSKSAIKDAFVKLNIERDIKEITVKDILTEANVSRGTFYSHFTDIYDVQEQVENDIFKNTQAHLKLQSMKEPVQNPYQQVAVFLENIEANSKTIKSIHQNRGNAPFATKFKNLIKHSLNDGERAIEDESVSRIIDALVKIGRAHV